MSNSRRNRLEERRNKLIDKLIAFDVYKMEDKHLYELSLFELEREYKKFLANCHPHGEFGSIQWSAKN